MTREELQEIISLLRESDVAYFENSEIKIRLRKRKSAPSPTASDPVIPDTERVEKKAKSPVDLPKRLCHCGHERFHHTAESCMMGCLPTLCVPHAVGAKVEGG